MVFLDVCDRSRFRAFHFWQNNRTGRDFKTLMPPSHLHQSSSNASGIVPDTGLNFCTDSTQQTSSSDLMGVIEEFLCFPESPCKGVSLVATVSSLAVTDHVNTPDKTATSDLPMPINANLLSKNGESGKSEEVHTASAGANISAIPKEASQASLSSAPGNHPIPIQSLPLTENHNPDSNAIVIEPQLPVLPVSQGLPETSSGTTMLKVVTIHPPSIPNTSWQEQQPNIIEDGEIQETVIVPTSEKDTKILASPRVQINPVEKSSRKRSSSEVPVGYDRPRLRKRSTMPDYRTLYNPLSRHGGLEKDSRSLHPVAERPESGS